VVGMSQGSDEELRRRLVAAEAEAATLRRRLSSSIQSGYPVVSTMPETPSTSGTKPLAVVVPMIGLGDAFAEAGFRLPRPLVNVVGRPVLLWLFDHLTLHPQDAIFLAVPRVLEKQHGIAKMLSHEFPALNIQVVTLPFETRGWIETLYAVVRQMPARDLRLPLVTLDCSTIFHGVDVLSKIRELPDGTGASVYFDINDVATTSAWHSSMAAQFSYVKLDTEGFINAIAEKHVISSLANAGAYVFRTARDFRTAAEQLLELPSDSAHRGLYASSLISSMVESKQKFLGVRVDHKVFDIVSTPMQLQAFINRVSIGEVRMDRCMRFCFDLDGTLLSEPRVPGDLATCEPIPAAIALVRELHAAGHTIIITTSRGMSLGRGMGAAVAEVGHATFATLTCLNIPYDELHFGKPTADVYIDSRTLNAQTNIERDLGWRVNAAAGGEGHDADLDGAVEARAFNMVRAKGKAHVIKSSSPDVLRGECHWYRSIPPSLERFFPAPLEVSEGDVLNSGVQLSSITMAKVSGVTFSHLVTSRLLLRSTLKKFVHALHQIHSMEPPADSPLALESKVSVSEMCSNYAAKVKSRIAKHSELYTSLGVETGLDTQKMARVVVAFLEGFEAQERPKHAFYIHGDPVFSNVIRTADDDIVLIDMRGELGSRLTTQGDVHYDLSKVYQSLCGYDFMLLDQILDETSSEVFNDLRDTFWQEVRQLYPDINHRDVRLHTAAHFFAIVPLHEVRTRMMRYLRTSYSMLSVEGLM